MHSCVLPRHALLKRYHDSGNYTDCFCAAVAGGFSHADYVEAFYTSPLFKLERMIISLFVRKPSTDAEAKALAHAQADRFSAWTVEARDTDQLLVCDYQGKTRSWLMVTHDGPSTQLWFGTAIVKQKARLSLGFTVLLPFHWLYSRGLLWSAARNLQRLNRQSPIP
jgi:hypothetical protein